VFSAICLYVAAGWEIVVNWLSELIQWFQKIWNGLDESTKRQIIKVVIDAFDALLRGFYRKSKHQKDER
jgi:hypothetical protein